MNIIEQEVDFWGYCPNTVAETMNWIELAGRECYQSHDKIDVGSAEVLCKKFNDKQHTAMFEHSWLAVEIDEADREEDLPEPLLNDSFLKCEFQSFGKLYIVGNYRAWLNHVMVKGLDSWSVFLNLHEYVGKKLDEYGLVYEFVNNEDLPRHLRAITARFITSRDVTHELVRHRPFMAYAQKSQRYCADSEHVDFVLPTWAAPMLDIMGKPSQKVKDTMQWLQAMNDAEAHYHELLETKSPQEARVVLPNSCATIIVTTAPVWQWEWVEHLRTSPAAYPAIRNLIGDFKKQRENLLVQSR